MSTARSIRPRSSSGPVTDDGECSLLGRVGVAGNASRVARSVWSASWQMRSASGSTVSARVLARLVLSRRMSSVSRSSGSSRRWIGLSWRASSASSRVEFGLGDDEQVFAPASGQHEVAGLSVQAVGSDRDGGIPRAALGPVG